MGESEKRLGVSERLELERRVRWAFAWYVLVVGAACVDWILGMFGLGWPTLLGLQGPALLRRIGFSVVLRGFGGINLPLGPAAALLLCCAWAAVGYGFLRGVKGAFVLATLALAVDSLALVGSMTLGRTLGLWAICGFIALRTAVLGSWISVWRRLLALEKQDYSFHRAA